MNGLKYPRLAIIALLALPVFGHASSKQIEAANGGSSKLWLTGDSSLHAYTSTAHNIKVDFGFSPGKSAIDQLKSGELQSLFVRVPVKRNTVKSLLTEVRDEIAARMRPPG